MIQTGPIGATIIFVGVMVIQFVVWPALRWLLEH